MSAPKIKESLKKDRDKNRKTKKNLHERKGGGQDEEIQVCKNLRKY